MPRYRYTCPNGCAGVLAPGRMAKDDSRRFCFPCSSKSGKLVLRVAPALEKARAAKRQWTKDKAKAKRDRAKARKIAKVSFKGVNLRAELARLWKLPCIKDVTRYNDVPNLRVKKIGKDRWTNPSYGYAWIDKWQITISVWSTQPINETLNTLCHELAHLVDYARRGGSPSGGLYHDDKFKAVMAEIKADGYPNGEAESDE